MTHATVRRLPAAPQGQYHVLVAFTAGESHGYAIMQPVEASMSGAQ